MKRLFVVLTAIALVGAFTATAMAADWGFYGSTRMKTFYESFDKDASGTGESESYIDWAQQGNSRIGANVKVSDSFVGRFEYGTGVNLRILWAEYDFGGMKLGLGQHYTPISWWVGAQAFGSDAGLIGYGAPYGSRLDQIKLTAGGFQLALIESPTNATFDQMLPKIEARYAMPIGAMRLGIFGGYNTQKTATDDDINSVLAGLGFNGSFGAFWFNSALTYGSNATNAAWGLSYANPGTTDDATTTIALALALGMSASEAMSFEGGVGYWQDDSDLLDDPDTNLAFYVNMTYTIAPGFFVVPEVGTVQMQEDGMGNKEGSMVYAGAKWQMNF